MKRFIAGLVIGLLIASSAMAFADGQAIRLIVNGEDITAQAAPIIIDGRTLVPARALAEKLGATVTWDEVNRSVIVKSNVVIGGDPTDLPKSDVKPENNNPQDGKWLEGFAINGEIPPSFTDKHIMGWATDDNFYLELGVLNDFLKSKNLPAVQPRYPRPDIWFNSWYFISLNDVPGISYTRGDSYLRALTITID